MTRRTMSAMLLVSLVALTNPARAGETSSAASSPQFETIKQLAGDWVELGKDGKPTDKVVSSFRVTAQGTAVQETIFPGTDHEMVTMYYYNGSDLVLTHYCILGNQPKMRAEAGKNGNQLLFRFVSADSLKSETENHMHQATFTFAGKDRFQTEWVSFQEGKACHKVNFDLVRKTK